MPQAKARPNKQANATAAAVTPPSLPEGLAEVLTLPEAAAYLRIEEAAVLQAVQDQGLPGRRLGTEWRFFKPALQDWLRAEPRRKKGILAHVGAFQDDPTLEEMVKEIYQRRGRPETEEG
jgi:excisionase family DNA binding protein